MQNRRQLIKTLGTLGAAAVFMPQTILPAGAGKTKFRYCINTSTISGQNLGLVKNIEVAAKAGYDGIELWVRDITGYINQGNTVATLKRIIDDNGITVENAMAFDRWMVDDEAVRSAAVKQLEEEMYLLAGIGCKRIAACPMGLTPDKPLDLFRSGERYKQIIELGRKTGVMPQLEFWGHTQTFYHIGQAMMIASVANDPDVHILADVYHMFRGGSGFESLEMLKGDVIDIFHMNDYKTIIPREQQADKDRVYPGDGEAPMMQILNALSGMGGTKVLSLELFNQEYWKEDALEVAKKGLDKMKTLAEAIG